MFETLVVLPTYNEAGNLKKMAEAILEFPGFSILVVDDNSPDGTGSVADELHAYHPERIHVMHRPGKLGFATAYLDGFAWGLKRSYQRIVQMDADFSHDPTDLPRLVGATTQAGVSIGSRYVQGGSTENWPLPRKVISRAGSVYARLMLGLPVSDPTSGFKCFRRESLVAIDLNQTLANGFSFQMEMNWRCLRAGISMAEIPIHFADRKVGRSKMSLAIVSEAFLLAWRLRLQSLRPSVPPTVVEPPDPVSDIVAR
jgi:dolichol-phosphate mannosyltransferase